MMLPFNNEKNGNAAPAWAMALPGDKRTLEYEAVWKEAGGRSARISIRPPLAQSA
jgi:hypothetical protein